MIEDPFNSEAFVDGRRNGDRHAAILGIQLLAKIMLAITIISVVAGLIGGWVGHAIAEVGLVLNLLQWIGVLRGSRRATKQYEAHERDHHEG